MKKYIITLHQWALSHPQLVRPLHTAWQVGGAYLIVNASGVHNSHDLKVLLTMAVAAGLSAGKNQLWPILISYSASTDPHISTGRPSV